MIQKMKQWKKKDNNKGFTLVELIVVLVILAILAAILVPALLGYIDRAKQQQIVLNARSCYTAAQTELSSLYGQGVKPTDLATKLANPDTKKRIFDTADVPVGSSVEIGAKAPVDANADHAMYTVSYVKYTQDAKSIYFDGSAWVETMTTSPSGIKVYNLGTRTN